MFYFIHVTPDLYFTNYKQCYIEVINSVGVQRRTGLLDVTQLHTDRKQVSGTHPSKN